MEFDKIRRHRRLEIDEPVGVDSGEHFKVGIAKQFSAGGMLFQTSDTLNVGQRLTLTFQLPHNVVIILEGEVAYTFRPSSSKRCYGVRFKNPDFAHVATLEEYFANKFGS